MTTNAPMVDRVVKLMELLNATALLALLEITVKRQVKLLKDQKGDHLSDMLPHYFRNILKVFMISRCLCRL